MNIKKIEQNIESIKKELFEMGWIRPGSLIQRYNVCGKKNCRCKDPENPEKHGPYYVVVYTRNGKRSNTFIKPLYVDNVKQELKNYKRFKFLIDKWIELGLKLSKMKMDASKPKQEKRYKKLHSQVMIK